MGDYASRNVTYDLDASGVLELRRFDGVIFQLRRVERVRIRERGDMLEAIDLVNVDLWSHGRRIRLKLRVDDFYLVGYIRGMAEKAPLWEMEDKDKNNTRNKQVLAGSVPLRISVSYVHLENRIITIGHQEINRAFEILYSEEDPDHNQGPIQGALLTLAVMLCESTRFQWTFASMYWAIKEQRLSIPLPHSMLSLIKNWENISKLARKDLPEDIIFPNQVSAVHRYSKLPKRNLPDNKIPPKQVPGYLFDMYKAYNLELFTKKEYAPYAPYFARLLIRLYHIPRLREEGDDHHVDTDHSIKGRKCHKGKSRRRR